MRGRARTDWTQLHGEYIDHWHHRREYLVVGVIDDAAMRYDDPYMVWYRRITRTLVGNPAHRPTSGYVEIGSTIEIATRYIAAIHDRIDRAIYAYDRPESLQDMYDARDMCSRSLHALCEHDRIGQPGVPEPPPTIPPVVPATSPAMQPAFPVHPLGDEEEFDGYVDPLLASRGQIEIPVSVEGVSQITQAESQRRLDPEPEPQT
ncbi:serine/threonine-protein phosphatase 7 long form homolog [Actinidia eriantha]|uniref:serine/threonine-protein phosphatase 7 long form homolog n=1 Tax=Actinidia eriantha TaxID=165200 RepID=UPI0025834E00|nr:serine/threonine-protein phosphatase 7 long form homolog [Actinidia eriantha]